MSTGYDPRERPRGGTPLAGLPSASSHVVLSRSRTAGPGKDRQLTRAQTAQGSVGDPSESPCRTSPGSNPAWSETE